MRILQVHNYYLRPSGEDTVVANEARLLQENGHQVAAYTRSNRDLEGAAAKGTRARTALDTLWSKRTFDEITQRILDDKPDVVHVHNTFPLISPAVYWAATRARVAVVQTLHNYRLSCANGLLMRNGKPCEDCVGRLPVPAIQHRCYRDSTLASSLVAGMQIMHRALGTYNDRVHAYIALSAFAKGVMVRAGLPTEKVHVKPNFLFDHPTARVHQTRSRQVAFVGRVAYEKGLDLLLETWGKRSRSDWHLSVIGDGPERATLERRFSNLDNVSWHGWLDKPDVVRELGRSKFAVIPSRSYEGFPMVALEAMASGTPVIAPDFAAFPEIIREARAGLLFRPSDPTSLDTALSTALELSESEWTALSEAGVSAVSQRFGPSQNYEALRFIYSHAIESAKSAS